jgi:3-oxoacyl-[acyl-carrier protein] reductase
MVDRAVTEFGHLDWAVNNAGASARGAFLEIPVETFDRAVAVNLRGVMLAMRAEIPAMLDNRGGAIVNVASVGGARGHRPDQERRPGIRDPQHPGQRHRPKRH